MSEASKESVTYIILLSAMQVVLNCALELEDSIYNQGKVKIKVREAINVMCAHNNKNRDNIWKKDEIHAADLMYAVQVIGQQIAKGDGMALAAITKLTRDGFDLSRCVITELNEDQV